MANEALNGDGVKIWFMAADALGADITAQEGAEFQSYVTNFNESGGEREVDSIIVMGGGNIDKKKPQTQKELTFDIVMRHNPRIGDFKKIERGEAIVADDTPTNPDFIVGMIVVQQQEGSQYYYQAYNNVNAVVFDTEFSAEDEWRGTLRFKLSPTDADGISNLQEGPANVETDLTAWA